jgi:hypothetical protein
MTQQLRSEFKKLNYITSYIPGGYTGFVQIFNISFNKPLKAFIAQAAADYTNKYYKKYIIRDFIGDRRVLLIK